MVLRHRRHTFKGDYSTKKHVYGNGYSKAGIPQHHPPMAQNLQYPDDSTMRKSPARWVATAMRTKTMMAPGPNGNTGPVPTSTRRTPSGLTSRWMRAKPALKPTMNGHLDSSMTPSSWT
ncbi:hypothetical protein E2320_007176 [Naja naja]|nr:hypothetical protein E2320_007176 [Naja naja]